MGCCDDTRCILCTPRDEVTPDLIDGLLFHYRSERLREGSELVVSFFGGAPPNDAQLEAIGDSPFIVRVRPDLLSRDRATELVNRGMKALEIDALTLDDGILKRTGRPYRGSRVMQMLTGANEMGVRTGINLAPGLPGGSPEQCRDDATMVATHVQTARLHPVLVIRGSRLDQLYKTDAYQPISLQGAVTVCREMVEILEKQGVRILRIGQQPKPDDLGEAVAGPVHSSFRELVECSRTLDRIRGLMVPLENSKQVQVRCAPTDISRARGPMNSHLRILRADFRVSEITIVPDPLLPRGEYEVSAVGGT